MQSVIFFVVIAISAALAAPQRPYRPITQIPTGSGQQIRIISQTQDGPNPDGSYSWSFQAENGIDAQEQGREKNAGAQESIKEAQGSFQYTAPDGTPIQLSYVADENGFQPQGNHLPVPPPIPPEIQRSLEYNAAHPEEDDGNVRPGAGFRG